MSHTAFTHLFGTDLATVRTAVSAQLVFGAMFFSLTRRVLQRSSLPAFWVLANVTTLGAVFFDGLADTDAGSFCKLLAGLLLAAAGAMVRLGVRAHLDLELQLRRTLMLAVIAALGIGLPLWLFAPAGLAFIVLFNIIDAAVLFDATRLYVRGQKEFWNAQTGLLVGLIVAWSGFSLMTGVIQVIHNTLLVLPVLVDLLQLIHSAVTALIIISLNFFGFLLVSQKLGAELNTLASVDGLTGVLNRRAFQRAANEVYGTSVAWGYLLMLDIDHFKRINDTYGHAVGDRVLEGFADALRRSVRSNDLVGRTGGEEFSVLMPAVDKAIAVAVAERIRASVDELTFPVDDSPTPLRVTVSIGVASIEPGCTLDQTMAHADKALYAAKRAGRNRVVRATAVVCKTVDEAWSGGGTADQHEPVL